MSSKMRMVYPYPKGRSFQNEDRVTFKTSKELKLGSQVPNHKIFQSTPCLPQLSQLLTCLKENRYHEKECLNEVNDFQECYRNSNVTAKENEFFALASGIPQSKRPKMSSQDINALFKKYEK